MWCSARLVAVPQSGGGVNPIVAGLMGRCPNCGEGQLFRGFLKVCPICEACGFDLSAADSGDGPVVFIVLIGGGLVCFAALFTEIAFRPPIWVHMVLWLPLAVIVCLGLMRPFKGVMLAMQFHNRASEHRNDE
jgi:uncharacterized protein (DUF983 family)